MQNDSEITRIQGDKVEEKKAAKEGKEGRNARKGKDDSRGGGAR